MIAAIVLATSVVVGWPQWSQRQSNAVDAALGLTCLEAVGVRAGIKEARLYAMNALDGRWILLYRSRMRVAGSWDGTQRTYVIPDALCPPGDSCGVFPTAIDSAGNWISRECERRIYFRVKP